MQVSSTRARARSCCSLADTRLSLSLSGIVAINTYLEECTEPLNSIPDEHLAIVATLAQES